MALDDEPPDQPSGWTPEEANIIGVTHCCDKQWWIDRYGPAATAWRWWCCFGPLSPEIQCPPEGGEPQ